MKTQKKDNPKRPERLQNQLLFWLAAALAPEAMPWYSGGFSRSLLGQIDEVRRASASEPAAQNDAAQAEEPAEERRRAA
jgi:hypothetical protein